jgi:site-specific DNA-methyltransferase (cytosine-N4-specific)
MIAFLTRNKCPTLWRETKNPTVVSVMNSTKIIAPSKIEISGSMILEGDVCEVMPRLPDSCVQCVVTSPPYWGLRDYGISGQIGLEATLAGFLNKLTRIFGEVRRVLKPDGVLWLNIGDGFTSGNRGWRAADKKNPNRAMSVRPDNPPGLKDKDLLGVPWRLALALQADGWYLRSDIIWHKPNAMPESVKDRPTRAHEYIFMLTKEDRYTYFADAVMEAAEHGWRNQRTVWSINTAPSVGDHVASFPPELVDPCVLASTQPGDFILDPFFGAGTVGLVAQRLNRQFVGIELNPEYVREAERVLSRPAIEQIRRNGTRYPTHEHEHQPALLETPGKNRVRSRNCS